MVLPRLADRSGAGSGGLRAEPLDGALGAARHGHCAGHCGRAISVELHRDPGLGTLVARLGPAVLMSKILNLSPVEALTALTVHARNPGWTASLLSSLSVAPGQVSLSTRITMPAQPSKLASTGPSLVHTDRV